MRQLFKTYPRTRFVWLSGADILAELDQWQDWQWIVANIPLGILARPGQRMSARTSKAARIFAAHRLRRNEARGLALARPPVWSFVNVPMVRASSTALRAEGKWPS